MKELIQTIVVFVLVILAAILVGTTRGSDTLNFEVDFDFSTEEEFSYPLDLNNNAPNGEYKRNTGDYKYFMFGKNPDSDTYRLYFIQVGSAVFGKTNKNVVLRIDDLKLDSTRTGTFTASNNSVMKIHFDEGFQGALVSSDLALGDASIEGQYFKQKPIGRISLAEFQIYK